MKLYFFVIAILISIFLLPSCKSKSGNHAERIKYKSGRSISVPEPSGLDLTYDKKGFWTVSDETSTIYKLDSDGNVVKTIKVKGFDLEGVTTVSDTTIAVILERTREVLLLDTSGNEIKRKDLGLRGEANSGLEGITYIPESGHFYLLNEKKPSMLIELGPQFDIINIDTLNFSKDVSGIFYDKENKCLWILSDENQLIVTTDMHGNVKEKMGISIVQPEGITIAPDGKRIYIVSDNKEAMYVYEVNNDKQ